MRCLFAILCFPFFTLSSIQGAEDRLASIQAEVKPPERFKDWKPVFSIAEEERTFLEMKGPVTKKFFIIRDHDKAIAFVHRDGFQGGTIVLMTHDPAKAPAQIPFPTERLHIDTNPGASFRTDHWCPSEGDNKIWGYQEQSKWTFSPDKSVLTLTRTFAGKHVYNKWEQRTPKNMPEGSQVDHVGTFVIACDPVYGYTIDATWTTGVSPGTPLNQIVSLMPPYLANPMIKDVHQRVVSWSPDDLIGHANNHYAIGKSSGWKLADGGFTAYLDKERGWSWAQSLYGMDARLVVCNVHADQDLELIAPKNPPKDANGLERYTVRVRQVRLPPEITTVVWDRTKMRFADQTCVIIPLNEKVSFEDQPQSATLPRVGLAFTNNPIIATDQAHTGSRSLMFKGQCWPTLPQVALSPNHRYRLEAWLKVVPIDETTAKAEHAKRIENAAKNHEKAVEKAKKAGKEAPKAPAEIPYVPPQDSTAFVQADLYEWSPHTPDRALRQTTTNAKAGDWQQVELEFTAPAWAPFVDIRFTVTAGATAYLDDFAFVDLGLAKP